MNKRIWIVAFVFIFVASVGHTAPRINNQQYGLLDPIMFVDYQGDSPAINSDGEVAVQSEFSGTVEGSSLVVDDEGETMNISVEQSYDSAVLGIAEGNTHTFNVGSACTGTGGAGCTQVEIEPRGGFITRDFAGNTPDTYSMSVGDHVLLEKTNMNISTVKVYNPTNGSGAIDVRVAAFD
jgi:hypothetical protein